MSFTIIERRLDFARGIRLNIKLTYDSSHRPVGTEEEMDRLQDPAWKKLVDRRMRDSSLFRDGRLAYLMEKMMDRSMKSEEYEAIKEGKHPYLKRETFIGHVFKDSIALPLLIIAVDDGRDA